MRPFRLRIEYWHDLESRNWGFKVPVLNVVGGGCLTREEAEAHALEAVRFALDDSAEAVSEPGIEADYLELTPV